MLFNSFQYPLFLALVVAVFFGLPFRWRAVFLLLASYFFYACWRWEYLLLILAQTEINFVCGLGIARATTKQSKRTWLIASLVLTLAILVFFKYYNFANSTLAFLFGHVGIPYRIPALDILLPVGISFHTFQTLAYTIDLFRERIPAERNFVKFALYVSFFPLLVAGPIERAAHLMPQFAEHQRLDWRRMTSGMKLIVWGLFKKVVIADRLAEYVNQIYANPVAHSGSTLALATYFFSFQIYCDFSGYTDIAVGSARLLGCDLMENFRLPYLARGISDFWSRWHISLSTWFRDYLYIPLGGNRVAAARWCFNILVTFLVSGLWHGANWTFVVWGALHGTYFLLERALSPWARKLTDVLHIAQGIRTTIQVILTFHLVTIAWVFFRARTLADAGAVLSRVFSPWQGGLYLGSSSVGTLTGGALVMLLISVQLLQACGRLPSAFRSASVPVVVRWFGYVALLLAIALLGKTASDFIYFQF